MSINTLHTTGPLVFTHASSGSFNLDGIVDSDVSPEIVHQIGHAAGRHNPSWVSTVSASPMVTFACTDLSRALGNISLSTGMAIVSGGFTSADAYLTQIQNRGARTSGATNFRVRIVSGFAALSTITAEHRGDAAASGMIYALYDGTNAPFQYSATQSIPHTPSIDAKWTLGPIYVNGTLLTGVQRCTITVGFSLERASADGDYYDTFAGIQFAEPLIDIVTKEVPVLNTYGLEGTAIDSSDVIVFLRKRAKAGRFVADATEEHISITCNAGMIIPRNASGANNVSKDAGLLIQPYDDDTNAPFVVDAASAIS